MRLAGTGAVALDYGCGDGRAVGYARSLGIDMVGADVFYEGAASKAVVEGNGELGRTIFEMQEGRLPFPDRHFDFVCANQVFEHIHDLDLALSEISRVLKPGGLFLNIFPSIGVLREGHCGVMFAHWLMGYPRLLQLYLLFFRLLGFGHGTAGKGRREWSRAVAEWLCRFTVYRSEREIRRAYALHFDSLAHAEHDFAAYRLELMGRRRAARVAARHERLTRIAVSRLASMVLVARAA